MARKNTPESAGSQYATDQIASEHFAAWVRDQMLEASQADPSAQLPLETKADARVIAGNMLKQLEWDTKRELRGQELTNLIGSGARPGDSEPRPSDVAGFYDGFRKACDNSRDWLADELLTIKGEMGGGMRASRGLSASDVNFQNGERIRIRVIGPKGQLADPPFWYTVTGTMSVEDVALQFAQTIQPGMFVSISDGKNNWTFQKETHGGQNSVRRTHKLPTARYRETRSPKAVGSVRRRR